MRRVTALLAAALLALGGAGCGGDGAEPGAPVGATLVLDFTPNAAHSGIYVAQRRGLYESEGLDLSIRAPGESTDAPKLLEAGRAEFAILDIHDLGIARERGLELVGLMPIVNAPLASVMTRADSDVRRPRDLEGRTVGVTGLPSDEAVVDSVLAADGGDPEAVERLTIGFNAVSALAAGRVDAATAFWNAEGVALRRRNVPPRIFKVEEYGAPRYPELVLAAAASTLEERPELVDAMVRATRDGYRKAVHHPERTLEELTASVPGLDEAEQAAQLRVLLPALRPRSFDESTLKAWGRWDVEHGILEDQPDVEDAFRFSSGELLGGG
jgi:NitT/TauT family transport system substrate-binding protein/putative hydroxymethylpyrimidine transport system substrate-binding protein